VARELGRCWDTVNSIAAEATTRLLRQAGPARLDGVRVIGVGVIGVGVIGVDEHKWSHTRSAESDGFVTVITDLTAVVDGTGPARLLDLVPGRSAAAMRSWLDARDQAFRDRIATGPRWWRWTGSAATRTPRPKPCRTRSPSWTRSTSSPFPRRRPRGREAGSVPPTHPAGHPRTPRPTGDPLYRVRRALRTRLGLLTDRQRGRLEAVFAADDHVAVVVTWWSYQQIIAAYAHPGPQRGKTLLTAVIDHLRTGLPAGLEELATLGRTLHRRRDDVLAYFTHRASNGPTEAINGRLEALRRNALGFRNLINYRIRSLLHCGALAL
jgi:transposase